MKCADSHNCEEFWIYISDLIVICFEDVKSEIKITSVINFERARVGNAWKLVLFPLFIFEFKCFIK
jgi:hypothetical protein